MRNAMALIGAGVMALPSVSVAGGDLSDADLDERIDRLRRVDMTVEVRGGGGDAGGVTASYRVERHAFEFGTAIAGAMVGGPDPIMPRDRPTPTDEDRRRYDEIVSRYFTAVVAENAHKWGAMEKLDGPRPDREAQALFMHDWAIERGLTMRGHTIFWGIPRWLPAWQRELAQQPPDVIEARMKQRLHRVLDLFRGRIDEWDLNNEMMHGDIFREGMGLPNGAAYFHWAHAADPDVRFYVNEFGVLQGNAVDRYVRHIRELLDHGAKVGGIGDQAHFHKPVPSNEHLWGILDKLGQFGLPVKITEFDLGYPGMTEEEHAEQLRRFYRVCFAHPAVEGIYMWGFYEGAHWRPNTALWRRDWTPRPAAEAYVRLITEEWHTRGDATLDEAGVLRFRGFPGEYTISVAGHEHRVRLTADSPRATVELGGE
jgi:endo-1,4-beta-xylanase